MTHVDKLFSDIASHVGKPIKPPALWGKYLKPNGCYTTLGPYHQIRDIIEEDAEWVDGQFEFEPIWPEVAGWLERHAPHYDADIENLRLSLKEESK